MSEKKNFITSRNEKWRMVSGQDKALRESNQRYILFCRWNSEESLNGTMGRRNRALPKPRHVGGEGVNVIGPGTTGIPDLTTPKSGLR